MAKMDMDKIVMLLVIIGAVNWGLVGVFGINIVDMIAGLIPFAMAKTIIYGAVGVAGLLLAKKTYM